MEQIRSERAILFVGSGVSAALGLPASRGLVERLGADLGFDPEVFCGLSEGFRTLTEYYRIEKALGRTLLSYIFMTTPNAVQERILASWGIEPIVSEAADDGEALTAFMERLVAACDAAGA